MNTNVLGVIHPTHLVIVPGHKIYTGKRREHIYLTEHWVGTYPGYLFDDEVSLYVEHVRAGVILANEDPQSVLCFTGGFTADSAAFGGAAAVSEAEGYWNIAQQSDWFNCGAVGSRAVKEEYARDSYENLEFSCRLFKDLTGAAPTKVTVLGLAFKQQRYEYHADTIRRRSGFTPFRFAYVGVNNPPAYVLDGGSRFGEAMTLDAFKKDPHGDTAGGELQAKRIRRDPFKRGGYGASA